jgi:ABC-type multidrug transport system permease subunit
VTNQTNASEPTSVQAPPVRPAPAGDSEPVNGRWAGYWHLLSARIKELRREPEVIFWIFIFPVLLAAGLGIAFRNKPADVAYVAVVAGTGAERASDLLRQSPAIHADVLPLAQALDLFRMGKYDLVITANPSGNFEYRYDPARPESILARATANDALQTAAGRKDPLRVTAQPSTQAGSRYIDFLVPGLLGMNLMGSGMWGVGFALVDMRQRKLLKRYVATPMRRSDFLLAIASSRLLLMLVELVLLLSFGVLAFHMHIMGSWVTILSVSAVGALTFGGLGLLTASRAQKLETASGLINLVMMPMWIFSGVFFSYERFPAIVQPLIKALPLTALNDALRATILEGAPLTAQGIRFLILGLWGGLSFLVALRLFRWT